MQMTHCSEYRRYLKCFHHIWAWWLSLSCDQDHLEQLLFAHPMEAPCSFLKFYLWIQFLSEITRFQTLSRSCRDKHFDKVPWRLGQNCALYSVHEVFLRFDPVTNLLTWHDPLTKLHKDWIKAVPWSVYSSLFSKIRPSELVLSRHNPVLNLA